MFSRTQKELLIKNGFLLIAGSSIFVLILIMVFLFAEGIPIFKEVSVTDFLFGKIWDPTHDYSPAYGILAIIMGSISVTLVSSVLAIPLGVFTAIYLAEIAGERVRNFFKPVVEMLGALPSVVIGFFGIVLFAPFLMYMFDATTGPENGLFNVFNIADGSCMLTAAIMLAFMAVPTITSISEDAIFSVPDELREASMALGATHWQTIRRVVIPASLSGISTAVILGMSRSIGETMVVLMVAGNAAIIPTSLFDPVRPMPASIASEMGEAAFGTPHYHALFATGMVLFCMTLVFNIVAAYISEKNKQVGAATL